MQILMEENLNIVLLIVLIIIITTFVIKKVSHE